MTDIVELLRGSGLLGERAALVIEGLRLECAELRERIAELESQKTHLPILGKVDSNGVVHWRNQ